MERQDVPPEQRELVFCHECQNEWYRNEHGLVCPECQSDFTEIIEADNDPRENEEEDIGEADDFEGGFYAPDPDEDDIDGLQWEQTAPGRFHIHGAVNRTYTAGNASNGEGQQGEIAGGLMGLIGGVLQNFAQPLQQQAQSHQRQGASGEDPSSNPGSPDPFQGSSDGQQTQQAQPGNGTFIRHGHGPGFTYTIASTHNTNFTGGGAGLFPRNANGPQPAQTQPEYINAMLQRMVMNIGALPGTQVGGSGFDEDRFADVQTLHGLGPLSGLLNIFGMPGGQIGDAVYSQEALDRIITQLMEQNQAGNAPGPASEAAIQSLPTKQITEKDLSETGKADCSICMDEVPLGESVTVLPCSHWFHHDCIKAWLGEHDTCPHCRRGIMPKEGESSPDARAREASEAPLNDMNSPEYTRPASHGGYPFPRQNSSGGSPTVDRQGHFAVSNSPTMNRGDNTSERRRSSGNSTGASMFNRMREVFGRSSASNNPNEDAANNGPSEGSK